MENTVKREINHILKAENCFKILKLNMVLCLKTYL